jgi:hypothetical protein
LHSFSSGISQTPVISRANALFSNEEVLGVVDVFVRAGLDAIEDLFVSQ